MERKPIVNSDLIGSYLTIELPGFAGAKKKSEKCRIHYLEMGQGEPLLLVHSVGQSIYTWRDLMPLLARQYRVIAIDLPGFGHSDRPFSLSYSMDEMADVLLKIVDALHLARTHLLGCAMGGMYALHAMAKLPIRFDKVIALSPSGINRNYPLRIRGSKVHSGSSTASPTAKRSFKNIFRCFTTTERLPRPPL